MIIRKFLLSGAIAACIVAAGCGGSSGSSGSSSGSSSGTSSSSGSSSSGGATGTTVSVAGPLDTVQTTLSGSVLSPLEQATTGTPLKGVLVCTDDVVNQNTLDVVDTILNALQNPASAASAPPQIQALLLEMANNLGGLLNSLAGKGGCGGAAGSSSSSSGGGGTVPGTNPLAGTPLAPLGDALLPVLQKIQQQLGAGSSSGNGLADLASLVDQLNTAFQTGLAQVPASAFSQPIVGGVLTTLKVTVSNLAAVVDALATSNGTAFQSATQTLLDNLLVNVLTQVVPTSFIETKAGKPGTITGPIDTAAATFSAAVANALTQGEQQLLAALSSSQLAPVVNPVLNTLLPAILGPITQALAGAGGSSSSGGGVTGTPLDALLGPLTTVLTGILGGTGTTCVFANTPLSALCKLLP